MVRPDLFTNLPMLQRVNPDRPVARKSLYLPTDRLRPHVRFAHRCTVATRLPRIVYDFCFAIFLHARGTLLIEDVARPFEPGDALMMPPFEMHQIIFETPDMDPLHVAIHFDLAPGFPDQCDVDERHPYMVTLTDGLQLPLVGRPRGDRDWYLEAELIASQYWARTVTGRVEADAGLFRLIAALLVERSTENSRHPAKGQRGEAVLDRVTSFARSRLAKPLTLEELAATGRVSTSHLTRLFRTHLGYPPMAYLTRLRMIKARELLLDDRLSVKEVAFQVGYPDAHHFARAFHQFDGLSPSQYRHAYKPEVR